MNALQAGVHRFDEAGLLERNVVRDANRAVLDDPVHYTYIFGETPARRLETGCAANFLIRGALSERLVLAIETVTTRNVVEHHDPIAGVILRDILTDGGNDPGSLMSKDARS
jgi:hypothetical protein